MDNTVEENDFYFQKLDEVLDKELLEINTSRRDHHNSWDNHTLTLSTAAIGFSFTFLSATKSSYLCIFYIAVLAFVLSIVTAMVNYIFADKAIEFSLANHIARRAQHNKTRRRIKQLEKELMSLGITAPQSLLSSARLKCMKDVDAIIAQREPEKELMLIKKHNKKINFLNQAKTYCFLVGIVSISVFSLINLNA